MHTLPLASLAIRSRPVLLVLFLSVAQWLTLVDFLQGPPVLEEATAAPLALMFFFYLTSVAIALRPADLRQTALLWRALFAANVGYAIVLVGAITKSVTCCPTSSVQAALIALELYAPVLAARVCLAPPRLLTPRPHRKLFRSNVPRSLKLSLSSIVERYFMLYSKLYEQCDIL